MLNYENEKLNLERIANNSLYAYGVSTDSIRYSGEIFKRYMKPGSVLELGPAEGVMTDMLYLLYEDYTIVDGGKKFVDDLKRRYPGIVGVNTLFEEFEPERKYDNIILGHVLEHVDDPVKILQLCKSWLNDDGRILTAVPNMNSIHRQAAVQMGLQKKLDDFSAKDFAHGHRRVFRNSSFKECFDNANLKIVKMGGYWLKPLSDKQIEENWTTEMLKAFLYLGELYPDIAAEIYIVAE